MSSILEIFFPLCASDTVRWQRRTPDVEHGISDSASAHSVVIKRIAERGENIQVWIDPVVFNDLLNWLNALDEKYALRVTQIDASAAEKTGMVNVQRLEFGRG